MKIDQKTVQELLELEKQGDPQLIDDLVSIFLSQLELRVSEIEQKQISNEFDSIKKTAHSLKSSAAQLGLFELSELWLQLEVGSRESDQILKEIKQLIPEVQDELKKVVKLKDAYFVNNERDLAEEATENSINVLSNVTHELRTPLNGILGMSNLLLETSLNPRQLDYAKQIRICVDHMLFLVNDLMDAAKLDAGKMELEVIPFDINATINEVVTMIRFSLNGKKVKVEVEGADRFPTFFLGDSGRISQVLLNLLSNAVKFSNEGTVRLCVNAGNPVNGECYFQFEVIDTGIGISQKNLEKLFKAFSQADDSNSRKYGGTGLGLWISKKIVDLLNGTIEVKSALNHGSTFTVRFPLLCGDANTSTKALEIEIPEICPFPSRILVAEDNHINQRVIQHQLEGLGYKADVVGNGLDVLGALDLIQYDLILMDCQMPEMDGLEATRRIRQDQSKSTHSIPVIALTAGIAKEWQEKCLHAGMNDFMEKPLTRNKLKNLLKKWIPVPVKKAA